MEPEESGRSPLRLNKIKIIAAAIVALLLLAGCTRQENAADASQRARNQSSQGVATMKSALFIIAPEGFRDEEYYTPKQILEKAGIKVVTASTTMQTKSAAGKPQAADLLLSEADVDYDAIVFIGGPGTTVLFNDTDAARLAVGFYEQGKIVAAICIAPVILANAGLLNGKNATVFYSEAKTLERSGAHYTSKSVTVDGSLITGNGPGAADEFGKTVAKELADL